MDLDTYTEVHTQMQTDRHSLLSLLDRFLWEFGSWCRYSSRFSPFILSHWLRLASPGLAWPRLALAPLGGATPVVLAT